MPRHFSIRSQSRFDVFISMEQLASQTMERAEIIESEQSCRSMGCKEWPMVVKDNDVSVTVKIGRGCGCTRQFCQIHTTTYQPWQEYHTYHSNQYPARDYHSLKLVRMNGKESQLIHFGKTYYPNASS